MARHSLDVQGRDEDAAAQAYYDAFRAAEARVAELEAERQAIIDCLNLYGDAPLHDALDSAGLLLDATTLEPKGKGLNDGT